MCVYVCVPVSIFGVYPGLSPRSDGVGDGAGAGAGDGDGDNGVSAVVAAFVGDGKRLGELMLMLNCPSERPLVNVFEYSDVKLLTMRRDSAIESGTWMHEWHLMGMGMAMEMGMVCCE